MLIAKWSAVRCMLSFARKSTPCSSNSLTISFGRSEFDAKCKPVWPLFVRALTFAPAFSKNLIMASSPCRTATCNAVDPLTSLASMSALWLSRMATASDDLSDQHATWRGVSPSLVPRFTLDLCLISSVIKAGMPMRTAICRGEAPKRATLSTRHLWSNKSFVRS